jgi:hypothetical protein
MKVGFWAFAALENPNIAQKPSATLKNRFLIEPLLAGVRAHATDC